MIYKNIIFPKNNENVQQERAYFSLLTKDFAKNIQKNKNIYLLCKNCFAQLFFM